MTTVVEWGAVRLWLSDVWLGKKNMFYIDNLQNTKTRWTREVRARGTLQRLGVAFYVHECKHCEMKG